MSTETKKLKIYQINIRHYLSVLKLSRIADIPSDKWKNIANNGFNAVWLMGVWQLPPFETIKPYCNSLEQIANFKTLKPDFNFDNDICGSIFAIEKYEIDQSLGDTIDIIKVKSILNQLGLKLFLDFVPNHFHIDSEIVKQRPEIFVGWNSQSVGMDHNNNLNKTYSHKTISTINGEINIANGKDPFFPAWFDTAQINYSSHETQQFVTDNMIKNMEMCDGYRVDMASLGLQRIFRETFSTYLEANNNSLEFEFWEKIVHSIKSVDPNFLLISESYWNTQNELIYIGFDYVYLVEWMQFLRTKPSWDQIKVFKEAVLDQYGSKAVIFLENHDEERINSFFPDLKDVEIATQLTNYNNASVLEQWGQQERWKTKWPVQMKNIED
jgi:hypothetical protein